jgi:hypothetical protein
MLVIIKLNIDNKNMKKLNEYKVSENIINKRIKELAFKITKAYFINNKDDYEYLTMYYSYDSNLLYTNKIEPDFRPLFHTKKDLIIRFDYFYFNHFGQVYNKEGKNWMDINISRLKDIERKDDRRQCQRDIYEIVLHELVHYFDNLNEKLKLNNKYIDNLIYRKADDYIFYLFSFLHRDIVYFLSDEEIRAYATSYYIFGRCKKDYRTTSTYSNYQIIRKRLTNQIKNTIERIEHMVELGKEIDENFIRRIKRTLFNIKSVEIENIFNKLFYYVKLKNTEKIIFYLNKLSIKYINMFNIQLKKAEFTFDEYYKKGLNNEKFK